FETLRQVRLKDVSGGDVLAHPRDGVDVTTARKRGAKRESRIPPPVVHRMRGRRWDVGSRLGADHWCRVFGLRARLSVRLKTRARIAATASPLTARTVLPGRSTHSVRAPLLRTIAIGSAVRNEYRPSRVPLSALSRNRR